MSWKVFCPHFIVSRVMDDPERCHTSKLCPAMFFLKLAFIAKYSEKNIHRQ